MNIIKNPKVLITAFLFIAVSIAAKIFIPFDTSGVQASVAVKPEVLTTLFGFQVTNSLFTTWIVMIVITIVFFLATRNMKLVPSGLQNIAELGIEMLMGLAESVAGPVRAKKFFTLAATIFIFVLFANFIALIPGFGPIGYIELTKDQKLPVGVITLGTLPSWIGEPEHVAPEGEHKSDSEHKTETAATASVPVLAPFVRAPSSDINFPLALALISVIATQIYGFQALGFGGYLSKFFNFGRLFKGQIAMGLVDVFVGLLELISELGKILAFTFRLFGNIFAGEVLLLIMAYLFMALPLPFYALELFVAGVQAFVFCVLTLAFMTLATTGHGGESHGAAEHH